MSEIRNTMGYVHSVIYYMDYHFVYKYQDIPKTDAHTLSNHYIKYEKWNTMAMFIAVFHV